MTVRDKATSVRRKQITAPGPIGCCNFSNALKFVTELILVSRLANTLH